MRRFIAPVVFIIAALLGLFLANTAHAVDQATPPSRGGTGTVTIPTYGQVLVGQSNGLYAPRATSTLNISATINTSYPLQYLANVLSLAFGTSTSNTWGGTQSFTNLITGSISGNAATASALAGNGTNCSAGSYPLGIDASGNAETCTVAGTGTLTAVTGTYPVISSGGNAPAISLAFGTTSSNTWAGTQTFTNAIKIGVLSGLISGNAGTTYASATSSLTAANGVTGSFTQVGTGGSLGLATINAGVLGAAANGAVPTSQPTSTLYGIGANGTVLTEVNGVPTWVATTTFNAPLSWSNGSVSLTTSGAWSGNAGTATALAANGANCSSGFSPLGVDASGAVENCFDVWTEAENTAAAYAAKATTLTIAGTANQLTSSAGAQDLSANRTWTLSLPSHVIFPGNFKVANSTTTNATTTALDITSLLTFNGITGSTWSSFCTAITGSATLCDGNDAAGGGSSVGTIGTSSTPTKGQLASFTSSGAWPETVAGVSTSTFSISGPFIVPSTLGAVVGGSNTTIGYTGLATTSQPASSNLLVSNGAAGVFGVGTSAPSVSAPITYSGTLGAFVGGSSGSFGCTNASSGVTGCLTGSDWNTFNGKESALTFTWPLTRSSNTVSFGGLSTTSQPASSNVLTSNGTNGVYGTATSSLAVSAPITFSGTLGAQLGGSGGSFGCTSASAGVTGCLTGSDWTTFNNKQSTIAATAPIRLIGTTLDFTGLATTSQPASSNLLVSNGTNGVYGVATSSETCSSGISCAAHAVLTGGGAITLATINAGVLGAVTNSTVPTSQATSTLYGTATGGMVLGWSNITGGIAWVATSSAAGGGSPGGSGTELQYRSGASFGALSPSAYTASLNTLGLGTTTPQWLLHLASSTAPQLALSDGSLGNNPWTFYDKAGTLFIGTSSPTTFATSTASQIVIDANGKIGIGCANQSVARIAIGNCDSNMAINNAFGFIATNPGGDARIGATSGNVLTGITTGDGSTYGALYAFNYNTSAALNVVIGQFGGKVAVASTTPWAGFSIQTDATLGASPILSIGSSTATWLVIRNSGRIGIGSTSPSLNWGLSLGTTTVVGGAQIGGLYASSTAAASSYTVDWSTGNSQRFILNQNTNFVINATSSNPIDGFMYKLKICQDPAGSRTATFITPGQLRWTNGTTSILSSASGATLIGLVYDGKTQRYDVVASSTVANSCI